MTSAYPRVVYTDPVTQRQYDGIVCDDGEVSDFFGTQLFLGTEEEYRNLDSLGGDPGELGLFVLGYNREFELVDKESK